jgi:anti-sigma regulatory factor (Ser/Thr protein kinase)
MSKRTHHLGRPPDLDVHFSHSSTAPRTARRALQPIFTPEDPIAQDVAIVTSELVSNVIQHTDDGGTVRAWDPKPDVPFRLEVSDTGPPLTATLAPPQEVGGRGLDIVDALAVAWGVDLASPGPGKTVWAEFDRTPVRPPSEVTDIDANDANDAMNTLEPKHRTMTTTEDRATFINIYLDDHATGATAGSQRAARLAEAESESKDAAALAGFAADVTADFDALLALMYTAGVEPSRLKAGPASVDEKLGTLKVNGRVLDRSPLSTIIELEAMQMAVRAKRSLWETLQVALPSAAGLATLIRRADEQLDLLSTLHAERVADTFAQLAV